MKKILFLMTLLVVGVSFAFAQTNADIKFDKTTHDFGKFSENSPVVSCVFTFTNIGDAPLVILATKAITVIIIITGTTPITPFLTTFLPELVLAKHQAVCPVLRKTA